MQLKMHKTYNFMMVIIRSLSSHIYDDKDVKDRLEKAFSDLVNVGQTVPGSLLRTCSW